MPRRKRTAPAETLKLTASSERFMERIGKMIQRFRPLDVKSSYGQAPIHEQVKAFLFQLGLFTGAIPIPEAIVEEERFRSGHGRADIL